MVNLKESDMLIYNIHVYQPQPYNTHISLESDKSTCRF